MLVQAKDWDEYNLLKKEQAEKERKYQKSIEKLKFYQAQKKERIISGIFLRRPQKIKNDPRSIDTYLRFYTIVDGWKIYAPERVPGEEPVSDDFFRSFNDSGIAFWYAIYSDAPATTNANRMVGGFEAVYAKPDPTKILPPKTKIPVSGKKVEIPQKEKPSATQEQPVLTPEKGLLKIIPVDFKFIENFNFTDKFKIQLPAPSSYEGNNTLYFDYRFEWHNDFSADVTVLLRWGKDDERIPERSPEGYLNKYKPQGSKVDASQFPPLRIVNPVIKSIQLSLEKAKAYHAAALKFYQSGNYDLAAIEYAKAKEALNEALEKIGAIKNPNGFLKALKQNIDATFKTLESNRASVEKMKTGVIDKVDIIPVSPQAKSGASSNISSITLANGTQMRFSAEKNEIEKRITPRPDFQPKSFWVNRSGEVKFDVESLGFQRFTTSLKSIEENLGDLSFENFYQKAIDNPDRTFWVVSWGAGEGKELKEMELKLKKLGIRNVRLIGFSNIYFPQWAEGDSQIEWILDDASNFKEYFKKPEEKIDFLFSYIGLYHIRPFKSNDSTVDDPSKDHFTYMHDIASTLKEDGEVIYDYGIPPFGAGGERADFEELGDIYQVKSWRRGIVKLEPRAKEESPEIELFPGIERAGQKIVFSDGFFVKKTGPSPGAIYPSEEPQSLGPEDSVQVEEKNGSLFIKFFHYEGEHQVLDKRYRAPTNEEAGLAGSIIDNKNPAKTPTAVSSNSEAIVIEAAFKKLGKTFPSATEAIGALGGAKAYDTLRAIAENGQIDIKLRLGAIAALKAAQAYDTLKAIAENDRPGALNDKTRERAIRALRFS
ncbi:MAG: hypothetical protein NT079_03180, partial [Candidatus Omnitrophica bacterium]|nr:hypothetical protein [Candidatus Omnitrophota bacterium]